MITSGFKEERMSAYHERIDWLSKSSLSKLLLSPRDFYWSYLREECSKKETKPQILGTACHKLICEPDQFEAEYACGPAGKDRRHKAFHDFVSEANKIVLPESEYQTVKAINKSVFEHDLGRYLLSLESIPEQSCYWIDPHFNQKLKCRPDLLVQCENLVIDIKSTGMSGKRAFERIAADKDYHLSVALTQRGLKEVTGEDYDYVFLVIETNPPYHVAGYCLDESIIAFANTEIDRAISIYQECIDTNTWPGNPAEIQMLNFPKWRLYAGR